MKKILMLALFLILLASLLTGELTAQENEQRIIGYFTSWSIADRNFHVSDIAAESITHINYAFANISEDGDLILGDEYADIDRFYEGDSWHADSLRGCFHQLQLLKERHPHVKTLIAIGGHNWSVNFSDVAATVQARRQFAASCVAFMEQYGFDGIDLDWEYPVEGGIEENHNRPQDRENLTLLVAELRERLDQAEWLYNREFLLTLAASANPLYIRNIEPDRLHPYLDWINIMAYDFHGPWHGPADEVTNFNAPLYPVPEDPNAEPFHSSFNVEAAVEHYLNAGVPPEKLNLSLPFYGRGFAGVNPVNGGLFAGYEGPPNFGTWENGTFDFWDLKENYINLNGYRALWHDVAKVPRLYNPGRNEMISYDDSSSIAEKCQYVLDHDLGGAVFWEFSGDRDQDLQNAVVGTFCPEGRGVRNSEGKFSPFKLELDPVFPNPFNSTTTISYRLPQALPITLTIHDIDGRFVEQLSSGIQSAGRQTVTWRADSFHPGIYFVHLKGSDRQEIRKVILVK